MKKKTGNCDLCTYRDKLKAVEIWIGDFKQIEKKLCFVCTGNLFSLMKARPKKRRLV